MVMRYVNKQGQSLVEYALMISVALLVIIGTQIWFAGALLNANIFSFGKEAFGLEEKEIGYMLGTLAAGIGVGAASAGFVSRGKIETGLIPLGALGMTVFSALLAWPIFGFKGCLVLLFC